MFTLAEELLLIALDDEKGNIVFSASTALHYGLAGALLADLTIRDRINIESKKLIVTNDEKTGDEVLDTVLTKINETTKPKTVTYWVQKLGYNMSKTKSHLMNTLVQKGILEEKEEKVLWIFNKTSYPTNNGEHEEAIRTRIHATVFGERQPDAKTAMLLSLIKACSLVNEVFRKEERVEAKKKIDRLIKHNEYGKAVNASIEAMQTAIIVACTTAVTTATMTASNSGS